MEVLSRLNLHHLLYFHVLAREERLARAARVLGRSPQAVLAQVRALEAELGVPLFVKVGRRLVVSGDGRRILRLAEEIHARAELVLAVAAGRADVAWPPLRLGATDAVPKLLVREVIGRVHQASAEQRVVVHEGELARLVGDLELGEHDAILTDRPVIAERGRRVLHNHRLATSELALYARPALVKRLRPGFPRSLATARFVVPTDPSWTRRTLDAWLERHQIQPQIVAETADSALLKLLGVQEGVFPAPRILEASLVEELGARRLGLIDGAEVEHHLVTPPAPELHPALSAVLADLPLQPAPVRRAQSGSRVRRTTRG